MQMQESTAIKITAIVCLTALETAALITHTDGAYFGPVIAVIGGIAGWHLKGLTLNNSEPKAEEPNG